MNTIRAISFIAFLLLLATSVTYLWHVIDNNSVGQPPDRQALQTSYDRGVSWLLENRDDLLGKHNSVLWYMLRRTAEDSHDLRLQDLYDEYKQVYLDRSPYTIWSGYHYDDYRPRGLGPDDIESLRDYQKLMIHGLYCIDVLADASVIRKQLDANYCPSSLRAPACVTHQLMAVMMMQDKGCGEHGVLVTQLLDRTEMILTWDPRVADAYLQRVMMLAEAGREIDPAWVENVLSAQRPDGGWANFYPLMNIGARQLGFSSKYPAFGPSPSNFHATIQAVRSLSLLLHGGG